LIETPAIFRASIGQCFSRRDEPNHITSVFDGLSFRRLLAIHVLISSMQADILGTKFKQVVCEE
jgi:hypothetical protein